MYIFRTRYARLLRGTCLLFAAHIFNLSVDTKDLGPAFVPEDLSVNDIESFSELLAETILGFNNAFAEHDEPGEADDTILDFHKVFCSAGPALESVSEQQPPRPREKYFVRNTGNFTTPAYDITAPPPKS